MPLDYRSVMATTFAPVAQDYTFKDTILYALGVGAGQDDPFSPGEQKFVYEKNLVAMPTFAVMLGTEDVNWILRSGIDYLRMVHAEQKLTLHAPLPASGRVVGEFRVDEIYDKGAGKGAVMWMTRTLRDANTHQLLATVSMSAFLRGDGGCGGATTDAPKAQVLPDREPDQSFSVTLRRDQAVLYRLSGDFNPLHIDPDIAGQAGFELPIVHGLCSYGVTGRVLMRELFNNDPSRLLQLDARFTGPVMPGDTLRYDIWKVSAREVGFRCVAANRDVVVLNNGLCRFRPE